MGGKLTAVSLFSGCGGFDYGAEKAGIRILWANDCDPAAARAYRRVLPHVPFEEGDIRDIDSFPSADVLIGCYPCTGFSVASRRRWRAGSPEVRPRGKRERDSLKARDENFLFQEFLRALRDVRPRYFFVENVRGLVTAADGWFLDRQIASFEKLGYRVSRELLNAADFGVPQVRRRLFLVGVHREAEEGRLKYSFPVPTHGSSLARPHSTLRDAIGGSRWQPWPKDDYFDYQFHGHYLTRNRKRGWDEPSFTIVADLHHVPLHPMGRPMVFVEKDSWQLQGKANRRLSWRECRALQELPASCDPKHRESEPYTLMRERYRIVGNAVPPRLAAALLRPICGG